MLVKLFKKMVGLVIGTTIYLMLLSGIPGLLMVLVAFILQEDDISHLSQFQIILSAGIGFVLGIFLVIKIAQSKWAHKLNTWSGFKKN